MSQFIIPVRPDNGGEVDHWQSARSTEITVFSRYVGHDVHCSLGIVGPEGDARHEFGGPVVKGQYGYLVPQATVISAHGQRTVVRTTVAEGDILEIWCIDPSKKAESVLVRKLYFRIEDTNRMAYPKLVPLDAADVTPTTITV